jgi:hypothetical protein
LVRSFAIGQDMIVSLKTRGISLAAFALVGLAIYGIVRFMHSSRTVVQTSPAGEVQWLAVLEPEVSTQVGVDAKGQPAVTTEISDGRTVVTTSAGHWIIDGRANFAKLTPLTLEHRATGARYLCGETAGKRRCFHVVK